MHKNMFRTLTKRLYPSTIDLDPAQPQPASGTPVAPTYYPAQVNAILPRAGMAGVLVVDGLQLTVAYTEELDYKVPEDQPTSAEVLLVEPVPTKLAVGMNLSLFVKGKHLLAKITDITPTPHPNPNLPSSSKVKLNSLDAPPRIRTQTFGDDFVAAVVNTPLAVDTSLPTVASPVRGPLGPTLGNALGLVAIPEASIELPARASPSNSRKAAQPAVTRDNTLRRAKDSVFNRKTQWAVPSTRTRTRTLSAAASHIRRDDREEMTKFKAVNPPVAFQSVEPAVPNPRTRVTPSAPIALRPRPRQQSDTTAAATATATATAQTRLARAKTTQGPTRKPPPRVTTQIKDAILQDAMQRKGMFNGPPSPNTVPWPPSSAKATATADTSGPPQLEWTLSTTSTGQWRNTGRFLSFDGGSPATATRSRGPSWVPFVEPHVRKAKQKDGPSGVGRLAVPPSGPMPLSKKTSRKLSMRKPLPPLPQDVTTRTDKGKGRAMHLTLQLELVEGDEVNDALATKRQPRAVVGRRRARINVDPPAPASLHPTAHSSPFGPVPSLLPSLTTHAEGYDSTSTWDSELDKVFGPQAADAVSVPDISIVKEPSVVSTDSGSWARNAGSVDSTGLPRAAQMSGMMRVWYVDKEEAGRGRSGAANDVHHV
ncbi:hypothetical protein BDZ97DRAFT_118339 [Flammula alnicola]|nr:hypothetical protein BDZ97DRAFT_118339 [Flammula alnicola]